MVQADVQEETRHIPRLTHLRLKNYRALQELELKDLTPLTVFLGPNGSGKSTLFDVFAFMAECFSSGLRKAWDRRGRFRELRTRGSKGPIVIDLKYREQRDDHGYTNAQRASEMPGIKEFVDNGALLGSLWMEGQFDVGDPLIPSCDQTGTVCS